MSVWLDMRILASEMLRYLLFWLVPRYHFKLQNTYPHMNWHLERFHLLQHFYLPKLRDWTRFTNDLIFNPCKEIVLPLVWYGWNHEKNGYKCHFTTIGLSIKDTCVLFVFKHAWVLCSMVGKNVKEMHYLYMGTTHSRLKTRWNGPSMPIPYYSLGRVGN